MWQLMGSSTSPTACKVWTIQLPTGLPAGRQSSITGECGQHRRAEHRKPRVLSHGLIKVAFKRLRAQQQLPTCRIQAHLPSIV